MASEGHAFFLHPTTLDSIFQATYSSLPKDRIQESMFLPRSIRSMFVPQHFSRRPGDKLHAFTQVARINRRGYGSDIAVTSQGSDDGQYPFFQIHDFFVQAVPRDSELESSEAQTLCSKLHWEPDVLHSVPPAIRDAMTVPLDDDQAQIEADCVRASYYFIEDAVRELEDQDMDDWQEYHKRFYSWMKTVLQQGRQGRGTLFPGSQSWHKATEGMRRMLIDELSVSDGACQLLVRVGRTLHLLFVERSHHSS